MENFSASGFLWILLTAVCIVIILYGLNSVVQMTEWDQKKKKKVIIGALAAIIGWVALLIILSLNGFFNQFNQLPPHPVFAVLIPLPFVLLAAFSKTGTQLLRAVPQHWLVFMQSFRVFVELLLWFAFLSGVLPIQMTFEGGNLDILSGLMTLPIGYILLKDKPYSSKLVLAYSVIGLLLLLNILTIAVLSMPTPFRYFTNEPTNAIVAQFPLILLPGVLVPIAYSFHIFSLRKLALK